MMLNKLIPPETPTTTTLKLHSFHTTVLQMLHKLVLVHLGAACLVVRTSLINVHLAAKLMIAEVSVAYYRATVLTLDEGLV